jgi:signal transduction histidine kinase
MAVMDKANDSMTLDHDDLVRMNRVLRHRLRNLASGLKSSVTFLANELEDRLTPEEQEYFPLFTDACNAIEIMTNRMSTLWDPVPDGGPAVLGVMLDRILRKLHERFPLQQVELNEDCPLELEIARDEPIETALSEILINALEAVPGQAVHLDVRHSGDELKMLVCDHGAGTEEDTERLFTPFYTNKTQHIGIGLSIARRMIEACDGVTVATVNDRGGVVLETAVPINV